MDFILNEASVEDAEFNNISDESDEEYSEDESELFMDEKLSDSEQDRSFYRSHDNNAERATFFNQEKIADPNDFDGEYFGDDNQPELFDPENAEDVEFNTFENDQDLSSAFKKSLLRFEKTENPFLFAVIYGIMYQKLKTQDILLNKAEETLETIFFEKLKKIDRINE